MEERFKSVKIASILGILGNLFLLIIKGIVGIVSNSYSMIADSFNSLADIFSSVMTYIGNRIASKPRDDDHNLGHGKAEYIYSMLISIAMMYMAYKSFSGSFMALFKKSEYDFSIWLIIVCIITILVKFCLYLYTKKIALRYNTSYEFLAKINNITNPNLIFVGQRICVPSLENNDINETSHKLYIVQRGDTLTYISRLFGVSIKSIVELNDIQNPNLIFTGEVLKITTINH